MDFAHFFEFLAAHDALVYFCYRPADRRVLYVSPAYEHQLGGRVATVNEELPGWPACTPTTALTWPNAWPTPRAAAWLRTCSCVWRTRTGPPLALPDGQGLPAG